MIATIAGVIRRGALRSVFQPIVSLKTGEVVAHEGFVRVTVGAHEAALDLPVDDAGQLFERAEQEGCRLPLERAAARCAMDSYWRAGWNAADVTDAPNTLLFVNLSADGLRQLSRHRRAVFAILARWGIRADRLVFELTERNALGAVDTLLQASSNLREMGARIALDDYGTGHATLSLWVALEPDFLKIDASLVRGSGTHPLRFEALRAVRRLAQKAGTTVIAEGIETPDDLIVCRDLGIEMGQGFALSRPASEPPRDIAPLAMQVLRNRAITVFPDIAARGIARATVGQLLRSAPAIDPRTRNDEVFALFSAHPDLHAVAVVEGDTPHALINRRHFVDSYALPFHRELFGRKPCLTHANTSPLVVEEDADIDSLALRLSAQDVGYLSDGFVIVERGAYRGLGTAEDLMRAVTDIRIEAARYANPLTQLPGNIPIEAHMRRLIEGRAPFYACYCDLNDFKSYNDQHGYWQGDEVLRLTAAILSNACDLRRDFLGHVGGDDFLIFFQSLDWRRRVLEAIATFNRQVLQLYTDEERQAGGIEAVDRFGQQRFHGFVKLAAGVIEARAGLYDIGSLTALAAVAKQEAKRDASGFYVMPPQSTISSHSDSHPLTV
ncbi:GGDEF domain-containing protein [Robbsia andropogonis]|uniref:GGDEF domain-containing protein n=1 Tax=Robbsia andropogonis TaxID=28092 RepID=UPI002A6A01F9|nr:GGDEF domain-containing protein [Robbsia andropogonis]